MKIGIVGTGALGSVLAEKLSQAGHDIKVNNTKAMPDLEKITTINILKNRIYRDK